MDWSTPSRAVSPATADGAITSLGGPTFLSDIVGYQDVIGGKSDALSGISAINASTVQIQLSAPRSTFLMKLASAPASIVDRDNVGEGDNWDLRPNGSGPFAVDAWIPANSLVLR